MSNRKRAKLPTYDHHASAFAGIRERLALVSLVTQRTYPTTPNTRSMVQPRGKYQHEVRLMSKSEGWEVTMILVNDFKTVKPTHLKTHNTALIIEAARRDWHETLHIISKRAIAQARIQEAA